MLVKVLTIAVNFLSYFFSEIAVQVFPGNSKELFNSVVIIFVCYA